MVGLRLYRVLLVFTPNYSCPLKLTKSRFPEVYEIIFEYLNPSRGIFISNIK